MRQAKYNRSAVMRGGSGTHASLRANRLGPGDYSESAGHRQSEISDRSARRKRRLGPLEYQF